MIDYTIFSKEELIEMLQTVIASKRNHQEEIEWRNVFLFTLVRKLKQVRISCFDLLSKPDGNIEFYEDIANNEYVYTWKEKNET